MALCEVDAADLTDMVAEIRRLDPKPGADWDATPPQPVVPDVLMRAGADGGWLLELNPETMPRVLVNQSFTHACCRARRARRKASSRRNCRPRTGW